MSVMARIFTRQIVQRPKFYRQLFIPANQSGKEDFKQKSRKWNNFFLSAAAGIVSFTLFKDYLSPIVPSMPQVLAATATQSRRAQFNFIADVVETTSQSLVYIEIQDTRRMDYHTGRPMTVSNGSGFIIESDGLILTNAHVVINKPKSIVLVRLSDGRNFQGMVEAVDPVSDLATIRINCKNLPPMKLGNSSSLRSGEWVIALGSPLALSNTVTAGVVSSTERHSKDLGLQNRDISYIQTDAAITFGNSGGPLVNLDGEAIGINSMKVTSGISFAIPINYVKNFLKLADEQVKKGKLLQPNVPKRRYMGITMLSLTDDIIRELKQRQSNLPENVTHGILVWKVVQGSPAQVGGLMAGDIIVSINGIEVNESSQIYEILAGDKSTLIMHVYRGRNKIKVAITPEAAE